MTTTPRPILAFLAFLAVLVGALPVAAEPPNLTADWFVQAESSYAAALATVGDVNGDGYSDFLVGAPNRTYTVLGEGRIYLYLGSESGVDTIYDWSYASGMTNGALGFSIAPAGDTNGDGYDDFVVGAPGVSNGHDSEGRVYLFKGGPFLPSLLQTFEMNEEDALFGYSVSWAGDVNGDGYDDILAGAPEWGGYGSPFYIPVQGAARLYHGGPGGPDTTADWSRTGGQTASDFGYSVAGLGDVNGDGYNDVLIGSPQYDPGIINTNHGKVSCFLGSATGLSSSPDWEYFGTVSGGQLGWSVAGAQDMDGDGYADAAFSAPTLGNFGRVYLALGGSGGLSSNPLVQSASPAGFGAKISTMGDYDGDGTCDLMVAGGNSEVRIYEGTSQGWFLSYSYDILTSNQAALGGAGDVNGDGFTDFLIGDPSFRIARLYHGGPAITSASISFTTFDGGWPAEEYGASVDLAGDVNGDGYDDIIVGGPNAGTSNQGRFVVYHGDTTGVDRNPASFEFGTEAGGRFGEAVSSAGDVNGDGYDDVIVGEPGTDTVYVYHGSPTGVEYAPDWSYTLSQSGADFGAAVDAAGDVNGDGFGDVVVGAPLYDGDGGTVDQGIFCVFFGSAAGMSDTGALSYTFPQTEAYLGAAVAGVGDAHGDGFDDVLAGAPGYDLVQVDRGAVFGLFGDPAGVQPYAYSHAGPSAGAAYGSSVSAAGDVNGDGFADAIVGAPLHDEPGTADAGYVQVLLGDPTSTPYGTKKTVPADLVWPGRKWGQSVAMIGDLDGSGHTGLAVASISLSGDCMVDVVGFPFGSAVILKSHTLSVPGADAVVSSTGDPDGDGLPGLMVGCPQNLPEDGSVEFLIPHMNEWTHVPDTNVRIRDGGTDPIAVRGLLANPSGLELTMDGWLPIGRAPLRLEWQMQEAGLAYGGISTSAWIPGDPTAGSTPMAASAGSLVEGARYQWRMRVGSTNPYIPKGRWHTDAPNVGSLYGFTVARVTAVVDEPIPSPLVQFDAPHPNPFNPQTRISFRLGEDGAVTLRVVNVAGRVVRRLHTGSLPAGPHAFTWDGTDDAGTSVASGSYLVVLEHAGGSHTRKVTLVK